MFHLVRQTYQTDIRLEMPNPLYTTSVGQNFGPDKNWAFKGPTAPGHANSRHRAEKRPCLSGKKLYYH